MPTSPIASISKQFDQLYKELKNYTELLDSRFLSLHLARRTIKPSEYEFDVKAYCILSHAAFEEYFEKLILEILNISVDRFIRRRPDVNIGLITLIGTQTNIKIDLERGTSETSAFQYIKTNLEEAKRVFSAQIERNNGISIKDLRNLLIPVAINIKEDATWKNSLQQLSSERGSYAHKVGAKTILAPEDAKRYVQDCLLISKDVLVQAKKRFTR